MSIRKKILLIFIPPSVILMLILSAASHFFILGGFTQLERRNVIQNVLRLRDALNNDQVVLDQTINDWANWDDTYHFIENGNKEYIQSNLMNDTFIGLKLNLILYLKNTGEIVYGKIVDFPTRREMSGSGATQRLVAGRVRSEFHKQQKLAGVMMTPQGPLVIAACSVLTSAKTGPSRGILIMGYFLNRAAIQKLSQITHLRIKIEPYQQSRFNLIAKDASHDRNRAIFIQVVNHQQVIGYSIIRDPVGQPVLIASIIQPREIYHQGIMSINYYTFAIFISGMFFIILVLVYLKRGILDRLVSFNDCIDSIAAGNDLTIRVPQGGHDELTSFAELMNRMMENLQLSYENLKNIIEFLPDATFVIDAHHQVVAWNRAMEELTGIAKDEMIGRGDYVYSIPFFGKPRPMLIDMVISDITEIEQYYDRVEKQGNILICEAFAASFNRGAGAYFWGKASPLYNKDGRMTGAIQSIRDITKRRTADEGLRRYQLLSDQVQDIILFMDPGGKILEANQAAVNSYGYSRAELLALSIFDLQRTAGVSEQQKAEANRTGILCEEIHYRKDGSFFPVEVDLRAADIGPKRVQIGIARNITERKRVEQALKESEAKFRLVFHNNTDSIFVEELSAAGELQGIVEVNETACRVWGYSREELLKMSVRDLDTGEKMAEWRSSLEELRQKGLAVIERVGVTKNKTLIQVEIAAHTFILNGKQVLLAVVRDITERQQNEEKLRQSMVQLRNALKAGINSLSSAIEMRDPYTAGHQERVTRFAVAIAAEMGLSEAQKEGIQIAGAVHDVGKLAIPTEILCKPTKLSGLEFSLIKTHSQVGYTILSKVEFPWPIAEIVYQHHERLNGSGYPRGLTGPEILPEAKILCVADVIEAISSDRPYRPALGMDKALEEILKNKGILYDPKVVEACQKLIREGKFD